LTRDTFQRRSRVFYKVVRGSMFSPAVLPADGVPTRLLAVGEVLEVCRGPIVEPASGLLRVRCVALRDAVLGWATVSGFDGGAQLAPVGNVFRVTRPTFMSGDAGVLGPGVGPGRQLAVGDEVEVIEWSRLQLAASATTRVRGKLQASPEGEGTVGWLTMMEADGTLHLEAI